MKTPSEIAKSDALWVRSEDVEKAFNLKSLGSGVRRSVNAFSNAAKGGSSMGPATRGQSVGAAIGGRVNQLRTGRQAASTGVRNAAGSGAAAVRGTAARGEGFLRSGVSTTRGRVAGVAAGTGAVGAGGGYAAGRRKRQY